jgi:pilus assembly protein Flp/PilA
MKKLIAMFVLCFSLTAVFAQESVELKNAGNDALRDKDYAKALENFEKAIAVWGDEAPDYAMIFNSGYSAFKVKDYDKAVKYFDEAITGEYKTETAYLYKATAFKAKGDTEAYVKTLTEGIEKTTDNGQLKEALAKNYVVEGTSNYNDAAKILKAAVDNVNAGKMKTTDEPYLAEIAKAKKEFGNAIEMVDKALELNPADETAKKIKSACEQNLKAL